MSSEYFLWLNSLNKWSSRLCWVERKQWEYKINRTHKYQNSCQFISPHHKLALGEFINVPMSFPLFLEELITVMKIFGDTLASNTSSALRATGIKQQWKTKQKTNYRVMLPLVQLARPSIMKAYSIPTQS